MGDIKSHQKNSYKKKVITKSLFEIINIFSYFDNFQYKLAYCQIKINLFSIFKNTRKKKQLIIYY